MTPAHLHTLRIKKRKEEKRCSMVVPLFVWIGWYEKVTGSERDMFVFVYLYALRSFSHRHVSSVVTNHPAGDVKVELTTANYVSIRKMNRKRKLLIP